MQIQPQLSVLKHPERDELASWVDRSSNSCDTSDLRSFSNLAFGKQQKAKLSDITYE